MAASELTTLKLELISSLQRGELIRARSIADALMTEAPDDETLKQLRVVIDVRIEQTEDDSESDDDETEDEEDSEDQDEGFHSNNTEDSD